jgi:hypothetical protein
VTKPRDLANSVNTGPVAGFRNLIINGNFDVWQRATSHTADGYGSADRWRNNRSGTTCTMSRQAFTLGQTDVPGEPTYFCRMAVTSSAGASSLSNLQQRIEGVRTFAGQQVTVSFWVKADGAKPIAVELVQVFGTGGSPSSAVTAIGTTKTTLSTSWQKVTVTATVPSISGKTLGSTGDDYLALVIWFDAGSDFNARTSTLGQQSGTFDVAQVQVEPGPVATPFERRPVGVELQLCQRYYEEVFCQWATNGSANMNHFNSRFKVVKRAAPTMACFADTTAYAKSGTAANVRNTTGSADVAIGSIGSETSTDGFFISYLSPSGAANMRATATASIEL